MNKFKQNGNQHIRKPDGTAINLNTMDGADYVLELQERVVELETETKPKPRRRGRPKKVGPGETK